MRLSIDFLFFIKNFYCLYLCFSIFRIFTENQIIDQWDCFSVLIFYLTFVFKIVFFIFSFHEHIRPFLCFFFSLITFWYGNLQNSPNTKQYLFEPKQNSLHICTLFYFFYVHKFIPNLENQYFYVSASISYCYNDCSIEHLYLIVWLAQITCLQSKQSYFCCFGNEHITYLPWFAQESDKEDCQTSVKPCLLINLHILTSYLLKCTIIMMLFYFFLILIS